MPLNRKMTPNECIEAIRDCMFGVPVDTNVYFDGYWSLADKEGKDAAEQTR